MQKIHHKKNELQEVEFFKDEECTEAFDFRNARNLYIQPVNGDCTPIFALSHKLSGLGIKARIFTPIWHLGWRDGISPQTPLVTLNDVLDGEGSSNVNLSKYTPEDNAVLFLSNETNDEYKNVFFKCGSICTCFAKISVSDQIKWLKDGGLFHNKITIFLPHGTQSELQKANEVAKELKEKYGVDEVNLFVLHCFAKYIDFTCSSYLCDLGFANKWNINKIITTNSTGILPVQDKERLQVIDCKEIFEEYLNEINLN